MCSVYVIKRTSQESLAIQMNGERTTERERKREKDRYTNNNNKNRESSKTHYHTRIFRFGGGVWWVVFHDDENKVVLLLSRSCMIQARDTQKAYYKGLRGEYYRMAIARADDSGTQIMD